MTISVGVAATGTDTMSRRLVQHGAGADRRAGRDLGCEPLNGVERGPAW